MIIFVGGIHGAGKGTIASRLSELFGLDHYSASDILKWEEFSPDTKNKNVEDISSTQDKLILGLNEIKKCKTSFILDGHFCLFNKNKLPERIPLETFLEINPKIISVVVVVDVEVIKKRMKERDNKIYELSLLDRMQYEEIIYAKEVSQILSIPYIEILNGNTSDLITTINSIT